MAVMAKVITSCSVAAVSPSKPTGSDVRQRWDAMEAASPSAERVVLRGWGHDGHICDPRPLARLIEAFADKVMP
jgi:hypothetical protein